MARCPWSASAIPSSRASAWSGRNGRWSAIFARRLHGRLQRPVRWRACGLKWRRFDDDPRADRSRRAGGGCLHRLGRRQRCRAWRQRREVYSQPRRLAATLRRKSPHSALVFAGIPPLDRFPALPWPLGAVLGARAARLQAAAQAAAREMNTICFDFPADLPPGGFASDGFHPAEDACDAWAGWLLEAWLSRTSRPARLIANQHRHQRDDRDWQHEADHDRRILVEGIVVLRSRIR